MSRMGSDGFRSRLLELLDQRLQHPVADKTVDSERGDGEARCAGTDKIQDAVVLVPIGAVTRDVDAAVDVLCSRASGVAARVREVAPAVGDGNDAVQGNQC